MPLTPASSSAAKPPPMENRARNASFSSRAVGSSSMSRSRSCATTDFNERGRIAAGMRVSRQRCGTRRPPLWPRVSTISAALIAWLASSCEPVSGVSTRFGRMAVKAIAPRSEPSVSMMIQSGLRRLASRWASGMSCIVGAAWTESRSGEFGRRLHCTRGLFGSASIIATRWPESTKPRANTRAAVVFPAPPFGLTNAMQRKSTSEAPVFLVRFVRESPATCSTTG